MSAPRLVSRAYQPSVAASRSNAAWSNDHQARVGFPVAASVPASACG
jgi:hypothetical protein